MPGSHGVNQSEEGDGMKTERGNLPPGEDECVSVFKMLSSNLTHGHGADRVLSARATLDVRLHDVFVGDRDACCEPLDNL